MTHWNSPGCPASVVLVSLPLPQCARVCSGLLLNKYLYLGYLLSPVSFAPSSPDVVVRERRVEDLEVGVVDVLKHEAGRLALRVAHHVEELDDVGAAAEVL